MYDVLLWKLNYSDSALSYMFKVYFHNPNHSNLCAYIASDYLRNSDIENYFNFLQPMFSN